MRIPFRFAPRSKWGNPWPVVLLLAITLLALAMASSIGAVPISWRDWLTPLHGENTGNSYVLWELRLPRTLLALLAGGMLGVAGALAQGLFRNPLADPGLLGVNSGAACAAALTIVFADSLPWAWPTGLRPWLLPLAAFVGALLVCFTLDRVARWITPGSIAGLLLTGIALNAIAVAVLGLCTYLSTDEQLRSLSFWTLGSLAGAGWAIVGVALVMLLLATWQIRKLARAMNALALGEAAAAHVGVEVETLRARTILMVALLVGATVAWCGMISFISLIAPHLVRTLHGSDQRRVLPLSIVFGGLLLLIADTLARTLATPAEIPVGIFTALLGGPFFLMLLNQTRERIG
ncbi:FecCD family ABC transporter permease [Methylovorus glucosotrophus]|uniref:Transport system permease protein n=1 Tax=Methylovorus glucosotrophus (strain SIP3-4) TaxID=582744 RepID=C6X794_METGS|nr:iron ABC transporter permease [Methylovorus glucosotrophus]ACT51359.1 transport system permease protein [Methylovorus glucosotrophus SIP3-4]